MDLKLPKYNTSRIKFNLTLRFKQSQGVILLGIVFFFQSVGFAENSMSPLPDPSSRPMPAVAQIAAKEGKALLKQFKKSQRLQYKALEHRQSAEIKELKASQDARYREWRTKEKDERKKFFDLNREGAKRRAYIKDFMERREALLSIFAKERKERVKEQEVRRKAIHEDQVLKQKQFEDSLKQGVRPNDSLWPGPGGY